jgi:hypothetical protein
MDRKELSKGIPGYGLTIDKAILAHLVKPLLRQLRPKEDFKKIPRK